MSRGYQHNFSSLGEAMHDVLGRERKAVTMLAVLSDYFGGSLSRLTLLNVGGSTGIIDNLLSDAFGSVVSIDIDQDAVELASENYKKHNLHFQLGDAMALGFPDESFDVVICSQIYEHVPDANTMMGEIHRVLRPGGVCYFAANNRIMWWEPHYSLPLLSVLPRFLAHIYIRFAGKADQYHELHYSYWGLKKLVRQFAVHDYSAKAILDPEKYAVGYMVAPGTLKARLAGILVKHFLWLVPGYLWVLEKKITPDFS